MALKVLVEAGFKINFKKSNLIPSQRFQYLGLIWDTTIGQVSLPLIRFQTLNSMALQVQSTPRPSCSSLMRLLGLMSAAIPAVPLIRLKSRFLQRSLIAVYQREADGPLPVTLSQRALSDLQWVAHLRLQDCAAPMWPPSPDRADLRVETDASDVGLDLFFEAEHHIFFQRTHTCFFGPSCIPQKSVSLTSIFLFFFPLQRSRFFRGEYSSEEV